MKTKIPSPISKLIRRWSLVARASSRTLRSGISATSVIMPVQNPTVSTLNSLYQPVFTGEEIKCLLSSTCNTSSLKKLTIQTTTVLAETSATTKTIKTKLHQTHYTIFHTIYQFIHSLTVYKSGLSILACLFIASFNASPVTDFPGFCG